MEPYKGIQFEVIKGDCRRLTVAIVVKYGIFIFQLYIRDITSCNLGLV